MIRHSQSRLGALIAALLISACSGSDPVAPPFLGEHPVIATGLVAFVVDPSMLEIQVSSCDSTEVPSNAIPPWQQHELGRAIELAVGCYDIRVVRVTYQGLVSRVHRVEIVGGDTHILAA